LRLARELRDSDRLGTDAIERVIDALRDFLAVAKGAGATRMIAVATSAVRDAADGAELVERAQRLGIQLQTIDGDHEALLGFYGAVHDLPVTSGVTFDVGGGSAELTSFRSRRLLRSWSMPLGSLRMSDRYLDSDPQPTTRSRRSSKPRGPPSRTRASPSSRPGRTRGYRRHRPQPGEDRSEAHRLPVAAAARLPPVRKSGSRR
jgi:exopolyphosphatase/pppGpp-phosphohydrolase